MKNIIQPIVLTAALLVLTASAFASNVKGGGEVTVSTPVEGNLYVGAGKVYINAPVSGDLVAGCGEISVKDSVMEDAAIGSGNARIEGAIGGDLRIGAGDVTIESNIGGDLVVGSGNIVIQEGVVIYGDLIIGGGNVTLNGTVKGKITITAGELQFNGIGEQDMEAKAGVLNINGKVLGKSKLAATNIGLGENARFGGDVAYWVQTGKLDFSGKLASGAQAKFDPSLQISQNEWDWRHFGMGFVLFWLWRLLTASLLIALMVWLFPRFFKNSVDNFYKEYMKKFGWGILYFLVGPMIIFVALITVIGIPLGLIAMAVYGISLMLCQVLTATMAAYELQRYQGKTWKPGQLMLVGIGMYILLKILMFIPFIGFLFLFILASIAFGSILMNIFKKEKPSLVG
jgi:hypothetical protein